MSIGFVFWLLMLLWILFGLYVGWPGRPQIAYGPIGSNLLLFILLFLLGWAVFGFIIQGGPVMVR
jgi:hypothetical protein